MTHRSLCSLATLALTTTTLLAGTPDIGPQIRIDVGGGVEASNETSAAASDVNPMEIVATWNDWRQSGGSEVIRMGVALSLDGGASWSDFLIRPPGPNQSGVEGDPMTAFDPRTGTLWVGAISFAGNGGIYVARKDPGQPTFNPSVMAHAANGTDKCWMAAGPRPGEPDSTRLYITYNFGVIWSDDMGDTWTSPQSLGSGIGFLPRVGPDGEVYVAYWNFGSQAKLRRSLDGGATFTDHLIAQRLDSWSTQDGSRFPGTFRVPPLTSLDVDEETGTLYAMYFDTTGVESNGANIDLYFTKSENQGTTWTTPTIINSDAALPGDQFFPWLESDSNGNLHVVYLDSRHTAQNDDTTNGMFDAYYACSTNGGATWTEARLTPNSWNSNNDGLDRPTQFIGDYLGMAVGGTKVYPVYLDTSNGDTDVFTNVINLLPGDTNGDGLVNVDDLLQVLSDWGSCFGSVCAGDVNGDFNVNIDDVLIVLANWTL